MTITDSIEEPSLLSSPSPSSNFSQPPPRHFYVTVVDRPHFKMETLVHLLGVAARRPALPIVVCCSSRDQLDAVCSAVSNLPFISLACLYSDLAESNRNVILEEFRKATVRWNQIVNADQSGGGGGSGGETGNNNDESNANSNKTKSHMIVATDACLPLPVLGEAPVSARVLINYELPSKETYLRRMATCLAADGIVINVVGGGEVITLKNIGESSSLVIAEMPINISEIL
ncbi:RNA HELICASE [Salix viminalis]|uniref:RNA HELICASE n=2 Tax=Salix viminalis TaxID=40686 RepID=A0A9Q0NYV5_SALVM|nr:RNA HELICASE [Salix viminalis]